MELSYDPCPSALPSPELPNLSPSADRPAQVAVKTEAFRAIHARVEEKEKFRLAAQDAAFEAAQRNKAGAQTARHMLIAEAALQAAQAAATRWQTRGSDLLPLYGTP
jgi:hypothetical protein